LYNIKKQIVIPHPDAESAEPWQRTEHVEKIHEFSLHVQNSAKIQTDSASGCGMTIDFSFFTSLYNFVVFRLRGKNDNDKPRNC